MYSFTKIGNNASQHNIRFNSTNVYSLWYTAEVRNRWTKFYYYNTTTRYEFLTIPIIRTNNYGSTDSIRRYKNFLVKLHYGHPWKIL